MRPLLLFALAAVLLAGSAFAQSKRPDAQQKALLQRYGPNFEEVLDKYGDDPVKLREAEEAYYLRKSLRVPDYRLQGTLDDHYVVRSENEPNDFFDTADNIDDVLAVDGPLRPNEYNGGLVEASFTAGDVDVFAFTVDTTKMYYFTSKFSFDDSGADDLAVNMRLYHESDLDTTTVQFADPGGGTVEKQRGDILGGETDGRNGSDDFRLTGWVAPVDAATGEKLTGTFYLFLFNEDGKAGSYYITAYSIDLEPLVDKFEPNQTNVQALNAGLQSQIPTDGVVRTFMAFNPDTVKDQELTNDYSSGIQGNNAYPLLLAQGDEDVDNYLFNYRAGHSVVIETMEYFGFYRDNDGSIGPGGTRMSDTRIRVYDADYTSNLFENDDGAREDMDGPNNTHARIVLTPENLAAQGITEDTPLWLWVSAWASQTREPGRTVNNSDPGRFMYNLYIHQYVNDPNEVEPNNDAATATPITARADTVMNGDFSDSSEDWYRVFMHEVRMYTLFVDDPDVEMELYYEYESDLMTGATALTGNLLEAGDVANGVVSGFVPDSSGAYLVKLSGGSGSYQLGVIDKGEIYDGRTANEPDDVEADAIARDMLEVGPGAAARTAMIYPAGDVDHYYFNVAAGTDLTLTLSNTNASLIQDFDVTMALIGPGGSEIQSSTSGISLTAPADGQYLVRVQASTDGDVGFYRLSGGEPFEEQEPNNEIANATAIALGGNIYEASLTDGDVDYFSFPLKVGNLYSFRSLDNETGGALSVELLDDPNGATLLDDSGWPDNYDGNFKIANIIPTESKTYYLKISGGVGSYKITSRINEDFLALKDKGEPNDTPAEADAMGDYQAFGADVQYVLFDGSHPRFFGDEDWFRVPLTAGQTLNAETKPVGGDDWSRDTDTRLVLFGADGVTELANDDDGGNDWYSSASYTAANDEVVYVQVRTSRDPSGADDRSMNRGDYILNINVSSEEVEPNNTIAEAAANPLVQGVVDASFSDDDGVDIYALSLETDHIYHIRTFRPEDGGFAGLFTAQLVKASDPNTNLLAASGGYNSRYSGSNVKLNIIPDEAGDYFLILEGDASGAYQVAMKSRDISTLKEDGEPNDTPAEADAIGPVAFNRTPFTSMLYNPDFAYDASVMEYTAQFGDDVDLYRVDLVAGDTLVAEMSPTDGPLWPRDFDGFMELLDANGDLVTDNDDGGFDWHSKITYITDVDGTFYVKIRSQDFDCANSGSCDRDPSRGEYDLAIYRMNGSEPNVVPNEIDGVPDKFVLNANYPNPFNPATTISYALPTTARVTLTIFNVLGQQVALLVDQEQAAGQYSVRFDAPRGLASGLYLYQLRAGDFVSTQRMLLIK